MPQSPDPKRHWRSLEELADTPHFRAFLEAEFPAADDPGGVSRRRWLQLMGASLALASVGGCYWEQRELLPAVDQPVDRLPGKPLHFATALDVAGAVQGLMVTSHDGRPIKIEGNGAHPLSLGATDAFAQASILSLYDPDRTRRVVRSADGRAPQSSTWDEFERFAREHFGALRDRGGEGLAVLAGASASPTLAAQRAGFLAAFPQARWYEYEPLSRDEEIAGARLVTGGALRTQLDLARARAVLTLDADLFAEHPAALRYARDFARSREVAGGRTSRLYAVEPTYTITGMAADHRLALRAAQVASFAQLLEWEVARLAGLAAADGADDSPAEDPEAPPAPPYDAAVAQLVRAAARDLWEHRGESVVAAGPRQPAAVHAAVHRLNAMLRNVGETVHYTEEPEGARPAHHEALAALVEALRGGTVETLLILGSNPLYNAPADLDFAAAFEQAKVRIHASLYRDETGRRCHWHLPEAHFLESWGDARSFDGTYSLVQPLIEPLFGGRTAIELLALLRGEAVPRPRELVRATFASIAGEVAPEELDLQALWRRTLHDGLLAGSAYPRQLPGLLAPHRPQPPPPTELDRGLPAGGEMELVFCRDRSVFDGRFANNGWLQETPDPLTKITWDNAALLSPATAAALGVEADTRVRLSYQGREVEMPVYILPGQAAGSVALPLGYGRTAAGTVGGDAEAGVPPVGANAYRLRTSEALAFGSGLTLVPTGTPYRLATTQDHHAIDTVGLRGRARRLGELIREAPLDEYLAHPDFARHVVHHPPLKSLWEEWSYEEGHRWGMSIDLSKCIGCNACVVACTAENNVPVVGRERVLMGREMHWIRVDRYFQGDPEEPAAACQPLTCHHCENAPCEQVCPVAATVHSREGLNDMVYNRCVGTRYCAINCPYKVRRFNYFHYFGDLDQPGNEVANMAFNPEVTVRGRGVMEKCTFCVQRIQNARIEARNRRRPLADGDIRTACQQACPAEAIEFGDLNDPASRVRTAHNDDRAYGMLAELNVKPRTAYLARIRNPNPELSDASDEHDRHPA